MTEHLSQIIMSAISNFQTSFERLNIKKKTNNSVDYPITIAWYNTFCNVRLLYIMCNVAYTQIFMIYIQTVYKFHSHVQFTQII